MSERLPFMAYAVAATLVLLAIGLLVAVPILAHRQMELRTPDEKLGRKLWSDPENGCEYLVVFGAGITPRLQPDGRQAGCRR